MSTYIFKNNEKAYLDWIKKNQDGYVLTTSVSAPISYMSLHRATCSKISRYMKNMASGAFTERNYFKICSPDPTALRAWIRMRGGDDFSKLCSQCDPDPVTEPISIAQRAVLSDDEFEKAATEAMKDESSARAARLQAADPYPIFTTITVGAFVRNRDVVAAVLLRANGFCEECNKPAPFTRASTGTPFLEVHHKERLADGGKDTVKNAVALCPNCHRKAHYG